MIHLRTKVFKGEGERYGVCDIGLSPTPCDAVIYEADMSLEVARRIVQLENSMSEEESEWLTWERVEAILEAEGFDTKGIR